MTKRGLIQFLDELVELASEENAIRAVLIKERLIHDFERSYGREKEVETEVSYLPPYYIAAKLDAVQEEQRESRAEQEGRQMMGIVILTEAVWVLFFSFAKAAGSADRRFKEIQRLAAGRRAGGLNGN